MVMMRIQFGLVILLAQWVVHSDAWLWSWTDTATSAPAVDPEGSGSPAGSGEPPSETIAKIGEEIIDEGHQMEKAVQTLDQTPEALKLNTVVSTTEPENEHESENFATGMSSHTSKPGNATSSPISSEGSENSTFTGNVTRLRSDFGSESASDNGSATGTETSWRSRFGTHKAQKGAVTTTTRSELDGRVSGDEDHSLGSTKSGQSLESTNNTRGNGNSSSSSNAIDFKLTIYSHESQEDLLTPNVSNNSLRTIEVSKDHQQVKVTHLLSGKFMANQELVSNQALQSSKAPLASQVLSTTKSPQISKRQPQIDSKSPDTTLKSIDFQPNKSLIISQKTGHIPDATQSTISGRKLNQAILFSQTVAVSEPTTIKQPEVGRPALDAESPQCLLLDTALPFCSSMAGQRFAVPNYFNQSSVEEIQALLNEWAWLLNSQCHHSVEWFFCLLLVPKCGSLAPLPVLPCQSFCEVLRDSCWTLLDEGRLPVECHTLPDEEEDGYQCLSVSNQKGNYWLK